MDKKSDKIGKENKLKEKISKIKINEENTKNKLIEKYVNRDKVLQRTQTEKIKFLDEKKLKNFIKIETVKDKINK